MSFYDAIRVGASGAGDYEVERSLRFNDDDSPYLSRTPSSAGNRKTFTFSAWVKRSNLGRGVILGVGTALGSQESGIEFDGDIIRCYQYTGSFNFRIRSTNQYRDPSAWYHIVFALDTTQASSNNRAKLYVNGEQVTDLGANEQPSQNLDVSFINTTTEHRIGQLLGSHKFDGYMAEINFIDGFQYDPSYFGETNALTGQWNPKKYVGSYGSNGYYLNFLDNSGTNASTLGKDSSGNGNNFTPNNFSVSAGVGNDSLEDTPTNNFCTLNSISLGQGNEQNTTFSNGNLDFTDSSSSNRAAISTFGLKTGKWYYELTCTNNGVYSIGWYDMPNNGGSFYRNNGSYSSSFGGGGTFGYSSWTTNDVIGVAIDFDSGKIWYAKNNSWQSGDPATGNSPTNTFTTGKTLFVEVFTDNVSGTKSGSLNFGQRAFIYTPPTGYKKINSANLTDPTILLPNKHFDTTLYTGTGSNGHAVTSSLNFSPDWVWVKNRSEGYSHALSDTVRGITRSINSDSTQAEVNYSNISSVQSNGFTVNGNELVNKNGNSLVGWTWNAGATDSATYTVKVVSDSGNKYRFNDFGSSAVTLDLAEGGTYTFDQSDSSMSSHPMQLSTTANGTHGGGSAYSTGVTYELDGSTVTASAFISGFSSASSRKLIITVAASAPTLYYYCYYHSGMGGQANTNTTFGSSNFAGALQSTVKANTTAGFSIVIYTGNGGTGTTVGHGLGVAPDVIIIKSRGTTDGWAVYHSSLGATKYLNLDGDDSATTSSSTWGNISPTSSVFRVNSNSRVNSSTGHVAYCFSEVAGYSKFGSYVGNGSSSGPFVFLGFRPAWILVKRTNSSENWALWDSKRTGVNPNGRLLRPDSSTDEGGDVSAHRIDMLSNGFRLKNSDSKGNGSGDTYVFFAFAEAPFKNSRAR